MQQYALMDFDEAVKQYHLALAEFVKGNYRPMVNVFSHADDVTLANPFGDISRGWESVLKTMERAASHFQEGTISFRNVVKFVTDEFAFLVHFEPTRARFDGREGSEFSLRVTSIFRRENSVWKLVHRHADPLTALQPPQSILQKPR